MQRSSTSISTVDTTDYKYDTLKSKSGTLRSTKSSASSNYYDYNNEDPSKPTKTDLLTAKTRGAVYNSAIGISSNAYANVRNDEVNTQAKPAERTATLNAKYSTLGRRPLPLTPDEMKQSKETPIPRVPDEMPLSAANLTQYRSLQRSNRNHNSHFNSLQRPHVFKIPTKEQQQKQKQKQEESNGINNKQQDNNGLMNNESTDRHLYAVTEL